MKGKEKEGETHTGLVGSDQSDDLLLCVCCGGEVIKL